MISAIFGLESEEAVYIVKLLLYLTITLAIFLLGAVRNKVQVRVSALFVIVLFVFIFVHSLLFAKERIESLSEAIFSLSAISAIFIISSFSFLDKKEVIVGFLYKTGLILLSIITFLAVIKYNQSPFYTNGRYQFLLGNSNQFAFTIMAVLFPILIAKTNNKLRLLVILVVFYLLVYLSGSRTMLFTLILVTGYLAYIRLDVSKLKLMFFCIFIGAISLPLLGDFFVSKYDYNEGALGLTGTRYAMIEQRIDSLEDNLLVGAGYQYNTSLYYSNYGWDRYHRREKGNFPLAILEEFGIIFGGIMLVFIFSYAYQTILKKNETDEMHKLMLVIALVSNMSETWIMNLYGIPALLFWFSFCNIKTHTSK